MTVALRRRRSRSARAAGRADSAIKEHRTKRWRHLDLGASRCVIECVLRRLYCPGCGDVLRGGAVGAGGLAVHARLRGRRRVPGPADDQTPLAKLMRIGWRSVGKILARVVADKLDRGRLDGLVMIGVDEVSLRRRPPVPDLRRRPRHSGGVVWAAPGRNAATLQGFFDQLTDEQRASIQAVSIDMSRRLRESDPQGGPGRAVAFDPFHVVQLGGEAADQVRRDEYNPHGRSSSEHRQAGSRARATPCSRTPPTRPPGSCSSSPRSCPPTSGCTARSCCSASCATSTGFPSDEAHRTARRVARLGLPLPAETVRQARPHDPQAQTGRARRD